MDLTQIVCWSHSECAEVLYCLERTAYIQARKRLGSCWLKVLMPQGCPLCAWAKSGVFSEDFVEVFSDHHVVMREISQP